MWRAALKSLLGRKVRLVLSTFAIVLGVAFVAGTLVFTDTLSRSFTALFASTVGDVVVRPVDGVGADGAPSTVTIPASVVTDLGDVPGAARVDGNVTAVGVFVVGTDDKVVGGMGAPGLGVNWNDAPPGHGLEGLTIVEGDVPSGPGEVALDAATAEKSGYEIGDQILLNTLGEQAVLRPKLVGLADFADGGSLNGATLTIFDTSTAQDLFLGGADAFNDLWVTAEDGVSQEQLRDAVVAQLPDGLEAVTGDTAADESASELLEAISFLSTFLLVFAGISLVVGAFLIVNTFSILVAQRSRELALLRALGASRGQVSRSVLLEALVLGLLGSTIGLGFGVLLALALKALFATFGLDLSGQELVFRPRTVLAAYAVGVLVTMAAAWLPARRTTRITPIQALSDDIAMPESAIHRRVVAGVVLIVTGSIALGLGLFGDVPNTLWFVGGGILAVLLGVAAVSPVISRPFLNAASWLFTRLFGTVGRLAGQNSLRNPRRTTATASALMIGLALASTMAIVGSSATSTVDRTIEENFRGDFVVSNLIGQAFSPTIGEQMEQVPGVKSLAAIRYGFGELDGDFQGVSAAEPQELEEVMGLELVEGQADDLVDGTALVSQSVADDGVEVGDTVPYQLYGEELDLEVVGVFADNPLVGFPYLTTVQTLLDAGVPDNDNLLVVEVEEGASLATVQQRLDDVIADLRMVTVKNQAEFAEEQRAPIDQLLLMIYALLGLALVIAVLGIVNTLALSIIERTREVGLLRAIGLSRRQLRWMITLESVVIAVLGAVLGVLLGISFGVALTYSLRDEGLEVISVPYGQLATFLVIAVVVGVLAAVLPARRAARLDVLHAIATE